MTRLRPLGLRAQLVTAMTVVAVASVAVSAVIMNRGVDAELDDFAHRDLRLSADNAAAMAASAYVEVGGWSERSVMAVRNIAHGRGDEVVVLDTDGRPVAGSAPYEIDWAAGAPAAIVVRGRRVGTVVASHVLGVDRAATRMDRNMQRRMRNLLLASGMAAAGLALLLALLLAFRLARPLHRLTEVARRMGAGELETRATGSGGGREIRRLAQTMDRLAAALRHQDELRRATAADVTHELRGALVGVMSRVEALRHGFVVDEHLALAQIEGDAHRVRRLVDDVNRLAEAQRPGLLVRRRPMDLGGLVEACVARYADRCSALGIELGHRVSPARVVGDPERLAQVIDNLLSNALRYTDPGGTVAVELDIRGAECVIEVADSGIGIAPDHLERIFDRFWRSPEARARTADGSGVGLALLSELVRVHDGRVLVESELGRGSTFSVFLPRHRPPFEHARRPAPADVPDLWRRRAEFGPAGARADAGLAG